MPWNIRKVLVIALSLPLFGIVAAFGIAPDTITEAIETRTVVTALALLSDAPETQVETYTRFDTVRSGDTIPALLSRLGVQDGDALSYIRREAATRPLFQLPVGRTLRVETGVDGALQRLRARLDTQYALEVLRGEAGFYSKLAPAALTRQIMVTAGEIRSSLYAATDAAHVPDAIAGQLVKLFSTDVDFHQDLRQGDRFRIVYEMFFDGAEPVKAGRVLAAEFINRGHIYRAVYFQAEAGVSDYFTPAGQNLRKAFLRSPVEFSRVTSGFTMSRFHPILNHWRAHKGVDFGAPNGTPIVATADGVIDFIGSKGGYGNVIELRHHEQNSTLYAHLSRFVGGLKKGIRVKQGDVIGYVGATGWATGPHLHYEFRVAGVHKDPLRISLPPALPVAARYRDRFGASIQPLLAALELSAGTHLARFE